MFSQIYRLTILAFVLVSASAGAQTGIYPFGSFDTVGVDTIDRGSLNVHIEIPVVTKQGRGVPFQYSLVYDGLVWTPQGTAGSQTWAPAVGFGLHGQLNEGFEGYLSYTTLTVKCYQGSGGGYTWEPIYNHFVYHDQFGVSHPFAYQDNTCTGSTTGSGPSTDGSGYSYDGGYVTAANGKQISPPVNSQSTSGTVADTNGNYVNNNGDGTFTDTLGKTALKITGSGTPSSPKYFTYSTPTGTAAVEVTYQAYTVQTAFGCSGVSEYNLSQNLPNTVVLADGSTYTFSYEKTPGGSSQVTGRLASVTLPQGGVVAYTYPGANNGIVCADGTPTGLTRSGGVGRTYARSAITSASSQTTVTDGLTNTSVYNFVIAGSPEAFYETQRVVNQTTPSGVLLTRYTCYNNAASPCLTTAVNGQITQVDTYEALGSSSSTEWRGSRATFNTFGLQTTQINYDFGASPRGSALRTETWTYPSSGIVSLLQSDTVVDGMNNQISSTGYYYDETTGPGHAPLAATSGLPQHTGESGQRGNLTTIRQYPTNGTSYLTTAAAYEDTGNAVNVTGPTGESTFVYDTATHAFATTVTPPTPSSTVSLPSSATNDPNSGVPLTSVDPNNQTTTYVSYDPLLRPTNITYPDGGKLNANYSANHVGIGRYMNANTYEDLETQLTSFGRLYWQAQTNGNGYYWNYYCYDNNGNLQFSAYRTTNNNNFACSGAGDSYTYDALGRALKVTHSDGSTVVYAYNGRASQVTDENGVSRVIQVDGLGRPTAICEISATTLNSVAPANCGLDITTASGFKTTYTYSTDTAAGNALKVVIMPGVGTSMQGVQKRTFETDWLGRTTSVAEPESGTTTYSYTYSTTAGLGLTVTRVRPQANQTGGAKTTTTTQYDSVGRVVSVSYSDGTAPKALVYDANLYWAQVGTNLKGRLAVTGTGPAGSSTWTGSSIGYDSMGRVINLWSCGPATCGTSNQASRPLSFSYDWAGNLTNETDGVSGAISYGRSVAGEVTSITNATYTNLPYNPPDLVSNVVNGPDGPVSYTLGNGLNVYRSYDSLGRFNGQWVCNGAASAGCSGGTQVYGTSSTWKGSQMQTQTDSVLGQQLSYGYTDGFNRLTSRTVTQGAAQNYTYSYDLYGNRLTETPLNGGYRFTPTINAANNQITLSGYMYDAAGNLTNDSVNAYTYDAEGNVIKVVNSGGTSQYVYDAFNRRVHVQTPSATTEYTYDYAGRRVSSWVASSNFGEEGRIYWDGQQIAYRSIDGTTYFDHQDTLGTERMRTNYGGSVGSSYVSLPWGDGYTATVNSSGADQDNEHFAGLEHDAESDTEHAQFRNYASAQGRWLAPDPYLGSYDLTNPQSFNRYAYVLNNPLSFIDRLGLDPCAGGGGGGGDGGNGGDGGDGPRDPNDPGDPNVRPLDTPCECGPNCVGVVGDPPPPTPDPCDALSCFAGPPSSGPGQGGGAPNNGQQNKPTIQSRMQQAAHAICGANPATRVAKSVIGGFAIGFGVGAFKGFVTGELFGGEISLGATGLVGAVAGGFIQGAVGAVNGLGTGTALAAECQAGFVYDPN